MARVQGNKCLWYIQSMPQCSALIRPCYLMGYILTLNNWQLAIIIIILYQVDKEEMKKKREDAVRLAQEKAEQEQAERNTKKKEAEKYSIKQQMKVMY